MMLHDGFDLSLIDFDRCDYGDPFEEFYKAQMFSRPLSEAFINGQVHAYFDNSVPEEFWRLFNSTWHRPYSTARYGHFPLGSRR